jgi:hypothetical protein
MYQKLLGGEWHICRLSAPGRLMCSKSAGDFIIFNNKLK